MKHALTVTKTGNSVALRIPKPIADAQDWQQGQKLDPVLYNLNTGPRSLPEISQAQRNAAYKAVKELQKMGAFKDIKDPVAWQRSIRKDRSLAGRA